MKKKDLKKTQAILNILKMTEVLLYALTNIQ